jgi:acylpyruvate hydrolase
VKIVVFGPDLRVGALAGEHVVDLNRAFAARLRSQGQVLAQENADARVPATLEAFITLGEAALEDAGRAIEHASANGPEAGLRRVRDVRLHAPWASRRIACVGGNYAEHLLGMQSSRPGGEGATMAQVVEQVRAAGQWGFWKVADRVAGPEDDIPYPNRTEYLDYEGEAAIVIGRRGKDISAGKLRDYVWGVTLLNDYSIRDGGGPARIMSYNLAKNFDGSTAMGPCIVAGELDPDKVDVETRVNGSVRQHYNTKDMVFTFAEVLEELSRDFSFVPGDVISGGTSVGTAQDQSKPGPDGKRPKDLFLKRGDVVELSSPQIGMLRNRIV